MKKTAIIIINWNSFDCTFDCLESLSQMTYADYDIILVDNGSKDSSGERLKQEFPYVIFLKLDENIGFTGSNNLAMNYSINRDYKYTLLLNNDTFVEPDFLEILVNQLDEIKEAGAAQPKIYYNHDRSLLWNGGSHFNKWTGIDSVESGKKVTRTSEIFKSPEWLTGCALLVRNDIIRKIGLLDESLFMYYDDVDYSFRIKQAGYKLIYCPKSVIYHIAGAAYRAKEKSREGFLNPVVHYYLVRNKIWILKKYLSLSQQITAAFVTFAYLIGILGYFLIRRRFKKFNITLKAIKDGLSGRLRLKYRFDKDV